MFLRYFADMPYAEIAAALEVSEGTVAAALAQAHDALRVQLQTEEAAMTDDDAALRERMAAQMGPSNAPDWDDVLARAGRRHRWPWRRRALFALPAIAVLAGGTAAATGIPPLGDVINGHGFDQGGAKVRETVVAEGDSPRVGHWQVVNFRDRHGLVCLKAKLTDRPRKERARRDGGYCSHGGIGSFGALAVGTPEDAAARGSVVVFGLAPRRARAVVLAVPGQRPQVVTAQRPPGASSSYWLVAAAPGVRGAALSWRDRAGQFGERVDVSPAFGPPIQPAIVLTGTAPVAGRWAVSTGESQRLLDRESLVEPEGLPCIELRLLRPPAGSNGRSRQCGALRRAPGFFKAEQRVPSTPGRAREVLLYGRAPTEAARVELVTRGKVVATTVARRGPTGNQERFWLLAVPGNRARGSVRWVGGNRTGPRVPVFGPD